MLALGAHPDDVEVGAGGILARHSKRGDEVNLVVFTRGEGGRGDPQARARESKRAAKILGASSFELLDIPVGELNSPSQKYVGLTRDYIRKTSPDVIYVHYPFDSHQVHRVVSHSARVAARDFPGVKGIFFYEELGSSVWGFVPNAFADITSAMPSKIAAVRAHASQVGKYGVTVNSIESLAGLRYHQAAFGKGKGDAEAFIAEHLKIE